MTSALNQLIREAFSNSATDVFLMEDEPPRVRIEGQVQEIHPAPIPRTAMEEFWKSCGFDPSTTLEMDLSWKLPAGGRLRVNLYHSLGRLAAVLRPIKDQIPDLTSLGLPAELLTSWMQRRQGIVLVTGPTGSGKSTTVAACLNWINENQQRHIVTLEDPIEFLFTNQKSHFSQREIRQDSESFAIGLRSTLRQSPDVIFLGEIRDEETAITAVQSAATGHLVISTLHSSNVVETLDRLTHILSAESSDIRHMLASQLIGVLSQQLLPRAGGGMFAALEYFQNTAGTRKWILENKLAELQDHLHKTSDSTNCSFLQYLIASVRQGFLDPDVARAACPRPQDFDRAMRGISS